MAVYKRGHRWYYDILIGGKRVKRSTDATDKRGAQIAAEVARRSVPELEEPVRMTLKEAIMRCYTEEWQHQKAGHKTVNRTLKIVDILGDIPLRSVDEHAISRLVQSLSEKGLSQSSINRYRAYLRRVLNLAQKKWMELDRVPYIKNTKEVPQRFKVYTAEDEKLILEKSTTEFAALASILLDTGLRLGEALQLRWGNVNLVDDVVTVWSDATKGEKSRGIPLTKRAHRLLWRYFLELHSSPPPYQMVFWFKDAHEVERIWNRFKKAQGITDKSWVIHAMRHTFASRLVQNGVDLYTVSTLLGHSTIKVTERYAHLNPDRLAQAVSMLEKFDDKNSGVHGSLDSHP